MANKPNQKIKLLYLLRMLIENTNEQKGMSTAEIIEGLKRRGIDAERKSIYRDMDALRDFGLEISQSDGRNWKLDTRPFSISELTNIARAIKEADFLNEEQAAQLLESLCRFASLDDRETLKVKPSSRSTLIKDNAAASPDDIALIQAAFREKRKIRFLYFGYNARLEQELFNNGEEYEVTPVQLLYSDGHYYLIVFDAQQGKGKNAFAICRVDRMTNISVSEKPAIRGLAVEEFDINEFAAPEFGIVPAERTTVVLLAKPEAIDDVVDKFGTDIKTFVKWDGRVELHVKAPLTAQFFAWVFAHGDAIKITAPRKAADAYESMLAHTLSQYE